MRVIDPNPYLKTMGEPKNASLGTKPGLAWLPISSLRVDPSYQREILRNGKNNIIKIAGNFDWSLFGVVVVARIGDNLFAIVDGQHRTTAAAARGIEEVPCIIIEADPATQAKAFAAINGSVTAISPLAIFAAQVAAGDPGARKLVEACALAGVTICRYPIPADKMKPGETLGVQALQACMAMYGEPILVTSLKALMRASRRTPGMVKAAVIKAICNVLDAEKSWCTHEARLLSAMDRFDLAEEIKKAEAGVKLSRRQVHKSLALALFDHLDAELG